MFEVFSTAYWNPYKSATSNQPFGYYQPAAKCQNGRLSKASELSAFWWRLWWFWWRWRLRCWLRWCQNVKIVDCPKWVSCRQHSDVGCLLQKLWQLKTSHQVQARPNWLINPRASSPRNQIEKYPTNTTFLHFVQTAFCATKPAVMLSPKTCLMHFRICSFHAGCTVSTICLCPKPFCSLAGNHLLRVALADKQVSPKFNYLQHQ